MGLREQARFARMGLREKAKYFTDMDLNSPHPVEYSKIFDKSGDVYPVKMNDAVDTIISICIEQLSLKEAILVLHESTEGTDVSQKTYHYAGQYGYPHCNRQDFNFTEDDLLVQLLSQSVGKRINLSELPFKKQDSKYLNILSLYKIRFGIPLFHNQMLTGFILLGAGLTESMDIDMERKEHFIEFMSFFGGFYLSNAIDCSSCYQQFSDLKDDSEFIGRLNQFILDINNWQIEFRTTANMSVWINDFIHTFFEAMCQEFGVEMGALMIQNEKDSLIYYEGIGLSDPSQKSYYLSQANESLEEFFKYPSPILLKDYRENSEIEDGLTEDDLEATSFFVLYPIIFSGHLLGALNILKLKDYTISSEEQKEFQIFTALSTYLNYPLFLLLEDRIEKQDQLVSPSPS